MKTPLMDATITFTQLRASLPKLIQRLRKGSRFTVIHHHRPAFRIVPMNETGPAPARSIQNDSLYRAKAVGRSRGSPYPTDQDSVLYGQ